MTRLIYLWTTRLIHVYEYTSLRYQWSVWIHFIAISDYNSYIGTVQLIPEKMRLEIVIGMQNEILIRNPKTIVLGLFSDFETKRDLEQ